MNIISQLQKFLLAMFSVAGSSYVTAIAFAVTLPCLGDEPKTPSSEIAHVAGETGDYFMCKNKGDVRTLRMHREKDGTCHVDYTKAGQDKSVASAKSNSFCHDKLVGLKDKLSAAGYTCRDISESVIHKDGQ